MRHVHRRQAVRRHAQHHHWHFYKSRSDWNFIANFARAPIQWRRERLVLGSIALLFGLLGFVVLPGWALVVREEETPALRASREIALPPAAQTLTALPAEPLAPELEWSVVEVRSGQTLAQLFANQGYDGRVVHEWLSGSARIETQSRRIRPGDQIGFRRDATGALNALRFDLDEGTRLVVQRDTNGISEHTEARALERRVKMAAGHIEGSLFGAGEAAGMTDAQILQLADVFGYDIDFAQDLREGDSFSVVFEELYREGERIRGGSVLAASFINQGKEYRAIRFSRGDGAAGYYDAEGRPLRKAFLRTPVEFTRISSRFSSARRHPILGVMRAHRGVDYAAPAGTPIKAAGNGRIAFRGWKSGYGNTIIVEHANKFSTLYGHMSRFGALKQGQKVDQGQIIGYVGRTGLATAPHLHYEFRVSGVHRDPLRIELPKAEPLAPSELTRFRAETAALLTHLERLAHRDAVLAAR